MPGERIWEGGAKLLRSSPTRGQGRRGGLVNGEEDVRLESEVAGPGIVGRRYGVVVCSQEGLDRVGGG